MYNPVSTYRLQLNDSFTLAHVEALLPYLRDLGITTIYAAPIFCRYARQHPRLRRG